MDNLILANIRHRPGRSLVTGLGIAVATVLILMTVGLGRGFVLRQGQREANVGAEIMVRAAGTFAVGNLSNQPSLSVAHAADIRAIPGVAAVTPVIQYVQASDSGFGFRAVEGVDFDQYAAISRVRIVRGGVPQSKEEVVIDEVLARERKVVPGGELEVMGKMMKVAGVYAPECGARYKVPLATLQERLATPGLCTMLLVKCVDPTDQEKIALEIQKRSVERAKKDPTENEDQIILTRDLPSLYSRGFPALDTFLRVVVGIAVGISMLVVLLAMYTTVTERTREIGILKSLGATNAFILRIVEQEALAISFAGALAGLVLAVAARFAVIRFTALKNIEFETHWIVIAFLVAVLGGGLGALYPALRAAHLDPVKALEHE